MRRSSRVKVLEAFDALSFIESNEAPKTGGRRNSHGGSARCDQCGHSLASGEPHVNCPIGDALTELRRLVFPSYYARQQWLDAAEDQS